MSETATAADTTATAAATHHRCDISDRAGEIIAPISPAPPSETCPRSTDTGLAF